MATKCKRLRTALPPVLSAAALALPTYAAVDCSFVKFVAPHEAESREEAGIWSYRWWDGTAGRYTCRAYPQTIHVDGRWKAARGFSSLTLIFGGFALANMVFAACRRRCCKSSRLCNVTAGKRIATSGILYTVCVICSSLSLVFVKSNACQHNTIFNLMRDHRCELSAGAKATYVAMVLWFVAAMLALCAEDGPGERRACSDDGALEAADSNSATEPLIQDVIFECEQSTYSAGQDGEE
ncbi:hypothetical protein ACHAXT_012187 [Thalassiosira profunda]